jgi:N-acetylmuramoyl-L-alanine amidase
MYQPLTPYHYAANNPVNYNDPSGLEPESLVSSFDRYAYQQNIRNEIQGRFDRAMFEMDKRIEEKKNIEAKGGGKKVRILIDAGHGGKYPGTTNGKDKEKDWTLKMAFDLRDFFNEYNKECDCLEIGMTRETDVDFGGETQSKDVGKRASLMEGYDIVISFHLDGATIDDAKFPERTGLAVYALAYNGFESYEGTKEYVPDFGDNPEPQNRALDKKYRENSRLLGANILTSVFLPCQVLSPDTTCIQMCL